ncbi:MAG: hypothetical protein L0H23_05110, partial [Luteimonas sp.]|nr:hypothetical protein [Luteimonas sp.]
MSLVESPIGQSPVPHFQPCFAPRAEDHVSASALRGHVDLVLPMCHAGVRSVRVAFEAFGAADEV